MTPSTTSVLVQFTEPIDPTTATNPADYTISGCTITAPVVLQTDGYTVVLTTTSALGTSSHTLTIRNLKTLALSSLPTLTASFTYPASGVYVPPAFTVGVNAEFTNDASPALAGTISDPAASVSVRVNGSYYAATNNGDGTWSLPRGDIYPALAANTYDVVVVGVSASGIKAFDSTVNELVVVAGTALPTVSITPPASPTVTPPDSIVIVFSEPVRNFTLQNLQLTFANGGPAASEPLEAATLESTDNQTWTLGNLSGYTTAAGTYTLTLAGQVSTITDLSDNPLSNDATASWTVGPMAVIPANATPNPVTGAMTDLAVLGLDIDKTEGSLTYSWTTTLPSGAAAPIFSDNGDNTAKNTTATFSAAGTYGFTVTITDPGGLTATSSVSVTVNQTLTTISVSGQPLLATAFDQFGNPLASQPAFNAGLDTITDPLALDSNVTVLPAAGSPLTISGPISGAGALTVGNAGTVVLSGANSYTGGTTVAAGTLVVTQSSAIAAGTSLTVGAGGVFIFDPSSGTTSSAVAAAATPVVASSADRPLRSLNHDCPLGPPASRVQRWLRRLPRTGSLSLAASAEPPVS